jgi:hypothetical protein
LFVVVIVQEIQYMYSVQCTLYFVVHEKAPKFWVKTGFFMNIDSSQWNKIDHWTACSKRMSKCPNKKQIFINLFQTFGITLAFKFRKDKSNVIESIVKSKNLFMTRTQQNAASREVSVPGSFSRFDIIIMSKSCRARRSPGTSPLSVNLGGGGEGSHSVTMELITDGTIVEMFEHPAHPTTDTHHPPFPIKFCLHAWGLEFQRITAQQT